MAIDDDEEQRRAGATVGIPGIDVVPTLSTDEGRQTAAGDFIEHVTSGGGGGTVGARCSHVAVSVGVGIT